VDRKSAPVAVVVLLAALAGALAIGRVRPGSAGAARPGRPALVLVDVDGLACSPCQEPLLQLARSLPAAVQEERMIGVLLLPRGAGRANDERNAAIALARWKGFGRVNGVKFPAVVDGTHSFGLPEGSILAILVFDEESGRMLSFAPPFGPETIGRLARRLAR
jgi:hypothetical protein